LFNRLNRQTEPACRRVDAFSTGIPEWAVHDFVRAFTQGFFCMSQQQQAPQAAAKKAGRVLAVPQKRAKRKIQISKIKLINAVICGTSVIETQY
jgi:hypothetical protein